MSNLTDIKEGFEAVCQDLCELNDKHSKSNEDLHRMTKKVEDRLHEIQAEMMLNRTEYERIIGEYRNAKHLLYQTEIVNLNASSRNYPLAPDSAANREVTVPDDDNAEVDPEHLRHGFERVLRRKGNGVPKETKAQASAT